MSASLDRILQSLKGIKGNGKNGWVAQCPAHEDKAPSLSITAIEGQTLLETRRYE